MKILETQSAVLTNVEVLNHLKSMRTRYGRAALQRSSSASMKSGNLETIMKELTDYLETKPSPLAEKPSPYKADTIRALYVALAPFDLTKPELLMIVNLRPQNVGVLDTIIEEMETRFDDAGQARILQAIGDVLGRDGDQATQVNGNGGVEDEIMTE